MPIWGIWKKSHLFWHLWISSVGGGQELGQAKQKSYNVILHFKKKIYIQVFQYYLAQLSVNDEKVKVTNFIIWVKEMNFQISWYHVMHTLVCKTKGFMSSRTFCINFGTTSPASGRLFVIWTQCSRHRYTEHLRSLIRTVEQKSNVKVRETWFEQTLSHQVRTPRIQLSSYSCVCG